MKKQISGIKCVYCDGETKKMYIDKERYQCHNCKKTFTNGSLKLIKINNVNEIIILFNQGRNCGEIARMYGCDPENIRYHLKRNGIDTSIVVDNIKCIYCKGKTQKNGKIDNKQRYLCLECDKVFTETTFEDKAKKEKEKTDKHKLIKKLYVEDKLSTTKIGKIIDVSPTNVGVILKNHGLIRTFKEARKLFKIENRLPVKTIVEDYKNGLSSISVANKNNCSKTAVLNILKSLNVERNNIYEYVNPSSEDIKKLYLAGLGMLDVARKLGVSYTTINFVLHKLKIVRTEDRFGLGVNYEEWLKTIPLYRKYRSDVGKITNKQPIERLSNYGKRGISGVEGAYQLDHKYSMLEGFKNGFKPEIIGNIANLEFIPWQDNIKKGSKCSITLEELLEKIKNNG